MTITADFSATTVLEVSLGSIEQIPLGEGRKFRVGNLTVAVFRPRGGRLFATHPECPHKSAPLADGLLGGSTLICPFHNRKFDLTTGNEIHGNCTLKTYAVHVDDFGQMTIAV